jgi:hypothetical protein
MPGPEQFAPQQREHLFQLEIIFPPSGAPQYIAASIL